MSRKARRTRGKTKHLPDRPRLSACLIVRDNQRIIEDCLTSLRPWVDEMIVVDTGSVDQTPQIAARLGANVSAFPWCDDFSAARNVSLERARGEWLFWMDSDDTIPEECGRKLRDLADGSHSHNVLGYVMQVHCPGPDDGDGEDMTVVDHVKLFRNLPQLRFEGRIHEQIIPAIRRLGGEVAWTDIFVVHSGSEHLPEAKQRKYRRDLHLLGLELAEHPNHPFHLFNMGMTYNDMGAHEEAVVWLRRALAAADPGESHVRKVYALLVGSLTSLGRIDEAQAACLEGLAHFPHDAELSFRLGIILHELGRLIEAAAAYRQALGTREERHFASIDPAIQGHKARHNLAVVYTDQGRHPLAELQWRLILERSPHRRSAWRQLGECLLRQGKQASLEQLLETMAVHGGLEREQGLLEGARALALGQPEQARTRIVQLGERFPNDEQVQQLACHYYYDHGTLAEAQAALEQFLQTHGEEPAALHNLGVVYYRQRDLPKAANALRRSLALRFDAPHTRSKLAQVEQELGLPSENSSVTRPTFPD